VLVLTDSDRMRLVAPVHEKNVARVHVGTPIAVRIGHDHLTAQVSSIAGDKIEAELANPNHELRSGPVPVRIQLPPPGKR
jgi:multidrug resistance efflux pump